MDKEACCAAVHGVTKTQTCPTFYNPMDCSPPGSSVHGLLQATTLEWVSMPFSRGSSQGSNPGFPHCKQILYHLSYPVQLSHSVVSDSLQHHGPQHSRLPRRCSGKKKCQCRRCKRYRFDPWVGKIPWRRKWQPTPIYLPGKFHEQRNLEGYSPWGRKESDMTESAHSHTLTHMHTQ